MMIQKEIILHWVSLNEDLHNTLYFSISYIIKSLTVYNLTYKPKNIKILNSTEVR